MVQYLLNASFIWLLSLVIFDLFLRRETFHSYNRAYLLLTFFAGLAMPLFKLNRYVAEVFLPADNPVLEVNKAKSVLVDSVIPTTASFNIDMIVLFIYFTGAAIALVLLFKELYALLNYYRQGNKFEEGNWTIIETGKEHSPFSLLRLLFVCDKNIYTKEEWDIICAHEYQHYRLFHFADLLIFQLAKAILWFNPLAYVFTKRLQMVHEFQADENLLRSSSRYGQFLLEQSMLASAPTISHSFNYSPIRNRIFMLTHRSPKIRLAKLVLVLPLTLTSIVFFTKSGYSFRGDGSIVHFKGNVVEFAGPSAPETGVTVPVKEGAEQITFGGQTGTAIMIKPGDVNMEGGTLEIAGADKTKGDEPIVVSFFAAPVKLNGAPVYSEGDISTDPAYAGSGSFEEYIFNGLQEELNMLEDGMYSVKLGYLIVNDKGKIAYYSNDGIVSNNANVQIAEDTKEVLKMKLEILVDEAPFKSGTLRGKPVNAYLAWGFNMHKKIVVKDHQALLR